MSKTIFIIGIGGKTGTMFAQELKETGNVFGIGLEREIKIIKEKKLYIESVPEKPEVFEGKAIESSEFQSAPLPDIIFLATKNPVGPVVKYYYQKIKKREKLPALVLSQNGISASREAKKTLEEILDKEAERVPIIRVSLFNPVDGRLINDKIYINYSLPIRLSFGVFSGPKDTKEIREVFKIAGIEAEEIAPENVENMEFSKLFLNLIGMASAARRLSVEDGFRDEEIFREEMEALREYVKVVRLTGGGFLNFSHYPVKLMIFLINNLPVSLQVLYREKLGRLINKGRSGKPKQLDEIDYYNGAVVELGKRVGIPTPVNSKILDRAKQL